MAVQIVGPSPVQLLLPGRRRSSPLAVALSVAAHVGLLAAVVSTGPSPPRAKIVATEIVPGPAVVYFAIAPPSKLVVRTALPVRPSVHRPRRLRTALFAMTPIVLYDTAVRPLKLRLNLMPVPLVPAGVEERPAKTRRPVSEDPSRVRGPSRSAELLGSVGSACPPLRRPPSGRHATGALEVAVAFVVDTLGAVEATSLRVVQSPDVAQTRPEFFPHIYIVGSTARVDRELRQVRTAYDSIVTDEVLRHVAALHFRPALRNGSPVQSSTILVACQAG